MSAQNTALAMGAAAGTAALLQPGNHLIAESISVGAGLADTIIEKTGSAIDWALNSTNGASSAILNPLAALYGGVKAGEFIDNKVFKFENKWLKGATRVGGGLVGLAHTPTAAVVGTGIGAWKAGKWAVKGLGGLGKKIWDSGYSKKSAA